MLGIEPTDVGKIAAGRGIPTLTRYFTPAVAAEVKAEHGPARVVTAANCFAHIEDVHSIVEGICNLLTFDGVFISESHYLIGLLDRLQYDTVYHEHLRYIRSTAWPTVADAGSSLSCPTDPEHGYPGLRAAPRRGRSTTASPRCSPPSRAAKRCWRA